MFYLVFLALILIQTIPHELGHAFILSRKNVKICQIRFGISFGRLPEWRIKLKRVFPKTILRIGLVVGPAGVKITKYSLRAMMLRPLKDQMEVYAAGLWAENIFSLSVYAILVLVSGRADWSMIHRVLLLAASFVLGVILVVGRRPLSLYLSYPYAAAMAVFVPLVLSAYKEAYQVSQTIELLFKMPKSLEGAVECALLVGFCSNFIELLPLFPADGSRPVISFLRDKPLLKTVYVVGGPLLWLILCGWFFLGSYNFSGNTGVKYLKHVSPSISAYLARST